MDGLRAACELCCCGEYLGTDNQSEQGKLLHLVCTKTTADLAKVVALAGCAFTF